MKLNEIIIVALVVFGLILLGVNFFPGLLSISGGGGAVPAEPNTYLPSGQLQTCESSTNPGLMLALKEAELDDSGNLIAPGAAVTQDGNTYVNGADVGENHDTSTEFDTLPRNPTDEYVIYLTDNDYSHFGYVIEGQGFCEEVKGVTIPIAEFGSYAVTIQNDTNYVTNASAVKQAISTGEAVSMKVTVKENTVDEWLAAPNSPLNIGMVCDYNDTVFKNCRPTDIDFKPRSVPEGHSRAGTNLDNSASKAYELIGAVDSKGNKLFSFKSVTFGLILEAKSGKDPTPDHNVAVVFYSPNLYYNNDTATFEWAYRKNDTGEQMIAPSQNVIYIA